MVTITRSNRKGKKYTATFKDGTRVHFGGKGCKDYIQYSKQSPALAKAKRAMYIKRHLASQAENWNNPKSPGALSRWILWEKPTLEEAIKSFSRRFRTS